MRYVGSLEARQMEAARALLDWPQENLANATELSITRIHKLELAGISPCERTMQKTLQALEDNYTVLLNKGMGYSYLSRRKVATV